MQRPTRVIRTTNISTRLISVNIEHPRETHPRIGSFPLFLICSRVNKRFNRVYLILHIGSSCNLFVNFENFLIFRTNYGEITFGILIFEIGILDKKIVKLYRIEVSIMLRDYNLYIEIWIFFFVKVSRNSP